MLMLTYYMLGVVANILMLTYLNGVTANMIMLTEELLQRVRVTKASKMKN